MLFSIYVCIYVYLYAKAKLSNPGGLAFLLFVNVRNFTNKWCQKASETELENMKKYNIAVVGATGMVGRTFLKVLEERK